MNAITHTLRGGLFLAVAVLVTACSGGGGYENLSASDFASALAEDPDAVLLDVRTPGEIAEGHIPGAEVVFIDFLAPGFEAKAGKLDPDKHYYVYCRSGKRSAQAASVLTNLGFEEVHNLSGGIMAWRGDVQVP